MRVVNDLNVRRSKGFGAASLVPPRLARSPRSQEAARPQRTYPVPQLGTLTRRSNHTFPTRRLPRTSCHGPPFNDVSARLALLAARVTLSTSKFCELPLRERREHHLQGHRSVLLSKFSRCASGAWRNAAMSTANRRPSSSRAWQNGCSVCRRLSPLLRPFPPLTQERLSLTSPVTTFCRRPQQRTAVAHVGRVGEVSLLQSCSPRLYLCSAPANAIGSWEEKRGVSREDEP